MNSYAWVTAIWQQTLSLEKPFFKINNDRAFTVLPTFLNGNHWALILVSYCDKTIIVFDPYDNDSNLDQLKNLARKIKSDKKPLTDYKIKSVDHTIQKDGWECGFFIMIVISYHLFLGYILN